MKYLHKLNPSHWLAGHELAALMVFCLLAGSIWFFAELADEVIEGETHMFDRTVLMAMRNPADSTDPIGPKWFEDLVRDVTALGGLAALMLLTLSVAGYLALRRRFTTLAMVLIAVIGGGLLMIGLKAGFDRPRPDLVPHGTMVYATSFPSGHSMVSAVVYLTLAGLLARVHPDRRIQAYLLTLGFTLTFIVGLSRVYLGVHWPTDVLAGWAAGAAWASLCWLVAWAYEHRRQLARRFKRM